MIKVITDIFMYLFEFLLFWYYSDSLFDAKKSNTKRVFLMLLNTAFLGAVYQFNITYLNVILMFVTYALLLLYLYNISFKTAVFHSLIFMVVMLASEILVMALSSALYKDFNAFESSPSSYLVMISTSKLIYFSLMIIILKLFAQKENNEQYSKYFWLLFIMPLTSIMILICFRYIAYQMQLTQTMSVLWIISCIGLLFANILVFIIYSYSLKNTKELYELKTIQHQEEQDKRYFEIIEQSNKEMRIFSHDVKNHLTQIRNFEDIEEVRRYVDGIYPDVERFNRTGISKNKVLDLIISKYATLCEKKKIQFSVDVKTANLSYVSDTDLSMLMNNLLDNAVEAAEKSDGGFIQVNVFSKNDIYDGLVIKNSCSVTPITDGGELKTTKHNKKMHGIGTKSIRKTLKKYNAVTYSYNDMGYRQTKTVFEKETEKIMYQYNYYWGDGFIVAYTITDYTVSNPKTETVVYQYDDNRNIYSYIVNGKDLYVYEKNASGDIIGVYNNGECVGKYHYDEYGNVYTRYSTEVVSKYNQLYYRGYIYDAETELYYLQSRYYSPEWGRFLNADIYVDTGNGLLGTNMYIYCNNDPINNLDPTGYWGVALHKQITHELFYGETLEYGLDADKIADGNGYTDTKYSALLYSYMPTRQGRHFDRHIRVDEAGGDDTRSYYSGIHIKNAINAYKNNDTDTLNQELGFALHCLQDYSSHGNIDVNTWALASHAGITGVDSSDYDWKDNDDRGSTNKKNCVKYAYVSYGARYKEAQEMTAWGFLIFAVFLNQ